MKATTAHLTAPKALWMAFSAPTKAPLKKKLSRQVSVCDDFQSDMTKSPMDHLLNSTCFHGSRTELYVTHGSRTEFYVFTPKCRRIPAQFGSQSFSWPLARAPPPSTPSPLLPAPPPRPLPLPTHPPPPPPLPTPTMPTSPPWLAIATDHPPPPPPAPPPAASAARPPTPPRAARRRPPPGRRRPTPPVASAGGPPRWSRR